ncbi:MAG: sigma-70 family RNA polymerase sigma factor, partial [Chloroflexota bacterium]
RIYNYILYRIQDSAIADDVTSQVFERSLVNLKQYNAEKGPFAAWLFTIARNAINDYLRRQKRRQWLSLDVLSNWASNESHLDESIAGADDRDKLLLAVGRLSERDRDLIGLKFASGLTNRRIAELTGLSESNVGVILYRTMRRLRTDLEKEGVTR